MPESKSNTPAPASEPELIVVTRSTSGPATAVAAAPSSLDALLAREGAALHPLFGSTPARARAAAAGLPRAAAGGPDLSRFHRVAAPGAQLDTLAAKLAADPSVEAAYVKPGAEPARINDMIATAEVAPAVTPDFTTRQFYLQAAPGGIDAAFAQSVPGGSGAGIRIIDIEGAWRFSHEDLRANEGGVVGGTESTDIGWRNHGTAVIGVIGGDRNPLGVTGIAPDAVQMAISIFGAGQGSSKAIRDAADRLSPGDVILIELHRPGPHFNFEGRSDQLGYIAVEFWPDDFAAIQYATARGVIVVEAAGNGAENFDDALYQAIPAGFPADWANPFNRANRDSGAILVGAGAPPPGTHGRDWGPDRSRLDFSNYGASVDVQGIGREITTCGYGDLQGGTSEDEWYTDTFSGTSSSSPIVVGAIASIQGMLAAAGRTLLDPAGARALLRATGSPQQDGPGRPATQRIGNRPDLNAMARALGLGQQRVVHVAGCTADGNLWHTIRRQDGTWFGFGDVEGQAGERGLLRDVDAQSIGRDLHLGAINGQGRLWHTIRRSDGSWQAWGDIEGQAGDRGEFRRVALGSAGSELHVCGVTTDGHLWHTIRRSNGAWTGFGDIEGQTGDRGNLRDVDCAAIGGELHVAAVNDQGRLWHAIRRTNGSWTILGDVEQQAGERGNIREVACAAIGGELHVAAVNAQGRLWHTIRRADGTWTGFGDVEGQAGDRGQFTRISIGESDAELHLCGVTSDAHLYHTIRRADGSWTSFGDVEGQAGDRGQFATVTVAGLID
ncbi:MAG TPA: S8 family serine peptidase [Polyangiales bacterium]|nr:S8 family serine peptidase [Polyangiales bacterium]